MIDSGGKSPLIAKKHSSFLEKKPASAEEFQGIRLDAGSRLHVHVMYMYLAPAACKNSLLLGCICCTAETASYISSPPGVHMFVFLVA